LNNLLKRTVSGALFVLLLTGCIYGHPVAFLILFCGIGVLGLAEFSRMASHLNASVCKGWFLPAGGLLVAAGFADAYRHNNAGYLLFGGVLLAACLSELFRKKGNAFQNTAFSCFGVVYTCLPFCLLSYLPFLVSGTWEPGIVYFPFVLVWANDTFAYLIGSRFGKHKLFPRISPHKSWEGAIGGTVCSIAAAFFLGPWLAGLSWVHSIAAGALVSLFGIFGDLTESMFKRSIEIKDSGTLMPGHGGVLDRFDAALFAIPALFLYLKFVF
jgi:phosphatidate cytidylyltransferase